MIDDKLILDIDRVIYEFEKREEKAKIATAKEMILDNEPLAKIIKYSKLPEKKIRQIAKRLSKEIVL